MTTTYPPGTVLKYNTLWQSGMHHHYVFFRVSHVTAKGTIMGRYLSSHRTCEAFSHDYSTDRWVVLSQSEGKLRRLPHPRWWEVMTEEECETGVQATSCVA